MMKVTYYFLNAIHWMLIINVVLNFDCNQQEMQGRFNLHSKVENCLMCYSLKLHSFTRLNAFLEINKIFGSYFAADDVLHHHKPSWIWQNHWQPQKRNLWNLWILLEKLIQHCPVLKAFAPSFCESAVVFSPPLSISFSLFIY